MYFVIILILMFTLELEFWAQGIMNCWYAKIIPKSGYIVILDVYDVRMYLILLFLSDFVREQFHFEVYVPRESWAHYELITHPVL